MQALDSTVLIEILRKNLDPSKVLIENEEFCTTAINLFEVEHGLLKKEKPLFKKVKNNLKILSFDEKSVVKTIIIEKDLRLEGKDIGKFDCMIAGCLLSHNVTSIITHNEKHFKNIADLKVIGVK